MYEPLITKVIEKKIHIIAVVPKNGKSEDERILSGEYLNEKGAETIAKILRQIIDIAGYFTEKSMKYFVYDNTVYSEDTNYERIW